MLNDQIFLFFYNFAHQSKFLDWLIIFVAHILPYLVVLIAIVFLLFHHEVFFSKNPFKTFAQKWKEISISFFSGITAWIIATLLKNILLVPRPYLQFDNLVPLITKTDFSFPSGHATFYMALAFSIYLFHKRAGSWFILIAILIGVARIMAGVHFPIDIISGWSLGIIIAYAVKFFYDKFTKKP